MIIHQITLCCRSNIIGYQARPFIAFDGIFMICFFCPLGLGITCLLRIVRLCIVCYSLIGVLNWILRLSLQYPSETRLRSRGNSRFLHVDCTPPDDILDLCASKHILPVSWPEYRFVAKILRQVGDVMAIYLYVV